MNQGRQPADVVDAYTQWAISSIDAWATSATAMAGKMNKKSYSAADWFAEAGVWTGRMTKAAYDLYYTLLYGVPGSPAVSDDYTPPQSKVPGGVRDLRLAGPLRALMTSTIVGAPPVKIVPESLRGGVTTFHLEVEPTNLPGDAYLGKVEVVEAGVVTETVDVVIQVP